MIDSSDDIKLSTLCWRTSWMKRRTERTVASSSWIKLIKIGAIHHLVFKVLGASQPTLPLRFLPGFWVGLRRSLGGLLCGRRGVGGGQLRGRGGGVRGPGGFGWCVRRGA